MLRIRRLYFYLVLYASLSMLLVGIATLLRVLLERTLDVTSTGLFGFFMGRAQIQEQTALGIALVLVGTPVWLLHWRTVQGWLGAPGGATDRASGLRRLYLYGALLTTGLAFYSSARDLFEAVLGFSAPLPTTSANVTGTLPFALTAGIFWLFHWRVTNRDRAVVSEDGASATLRRWYLYGMLVAGVVPLMINVAALGQRIWEAFAAPEGLPTSLAQGAFAGTLASSGATVLVALGVWLGHQAWSQTMVSVPLWHGESERNSVLRKVYLYGMVLVTVAWALFNASEILRFVIANALDVAPTSIGGTPVIVALGAPLMNAVVFSVFWGFYWSAVSREAASQSEVGRQTAVRRLYFYLVSAIALAFVGWSAASLLRLGVDALLPAMAVDPGAARGELARSASWLLVGLPVWLWHWSRSQALTGGSLGLQETRSTTRRWYLYIVAFAGVAVLLFSGARVVYEIVLIGLGRSADAALIANLGHAASDALVAGIVLWYHWFLVLRADVAALREVAQTRQAVAVVAGLDPLDVTRLEQFVRTSLNGSRTRIYWTDQAHTGAAVNEALEAGPHETSA
jgi:uncharacterized protein DUF5671